MIIKAAFGFGSLTGVHMKFAHPLREKQNAILTGKTALSILVIDPAVQQELNTVWMTSSTHPFFWLLDFKRQWGWHRHVNYPLPVSVPFQNVTSNCWSHTSLSLSLRVETWRPSPGTITV